MKIYVSMVPGAGCQALRAFHTARFMLSISGASHFHALRFMLFQCMFFHFQIVPTVQFDRFDLV